MLAQFPIKLFGGKQLCEQGARCYFLSPQVMAKPLTLEGPLGEPVEVWLRPVRGLQVGYAYTIEPKEVLCRAA